MTMPRTPRALRASVRREWPLSVSVATTALFLVWGGGWLAELHHPAWFASMFGWLFAAILLSAFAVVRHAEGLAVRLGEPLGTLVLTLSMSGMEMMMIAAVMYAGHGESTLARDTMLAIVMIVLNGLVGASLLLGGLRYHEQTYNVYGANAFLAVILPDRRARTGSAELHRVVAGPHPLPAAGGLSRRDVGGAVWRVPGDPDAAPSRLLRRARRLGGAAKARSPHDGTGVHSAAYHGLLLLAYVLPIVFLAKQIAVPINHAILVLGAPAALGGLLVAVLILSPESLAAVRAALANQLQRSINLALGTALSSISLTIPAVLDDRIPDGQDHHPRPRRRQHDPAVADAGGEHADLRPRTDQRPPGGGAPAAVRRLSDAHL